MKPTLRVDSLHLTVRGVPVGAAAAAVRGLGPALARELGAAGPDRVGNGAQPVAPRGGGEAGLRGALAARVAVAIRPHLNSQP
jgi:hypothetical protein